ncbi:hypothetical protein EZV62_010042 [Acer yangbiense]|uniref:Uncharacterized protein n=1 Tax=Acer yangbiense TaxID=1000413 RepID=A0A5C7I257_9ROSI|nr:hypothetical protein EZV62_010042 [Acer yangbiense]
MCASYLRTVEFCFSKTKTSINFRYYFLQLRSFNSQAKFRNAHYRRLTYSDSQILHLHSRNKLQDARNLINEMTQRNPGHGLVVHLTSLLTKFSKHGFIDESKVLFELMPLRNVVTYAMLSGFLQNGRLGDASRLFEDMPERNVVSWTAMIYSLADSGRLSEVKRLFEEMPERNVVSWNSMVVGLIRNGELEEARQIFDGMPEKNIVSWNTMIAGYAESYRMGEARVLFEEMEERNVVTWTSMIAGYCRAGEVDKGMGFPQLGKQLHAQVIVNSLAYDDYDGRLSRSFIHMYSSFGIMDFARYIFNKNMNIYTVQSCNAMINGYIRIGRLDEAQTLFDTIPDRDEISWTSLIDGDLVSWNSIIMGFSHHGLASETLKVFESMLESGTHPNSLTFLGVLSACSHAGMISQGWKLFNAMRDVYAIQPVLEHHVCMINLLGQAGRVKEAEEYVLRLPFEPDHHIWGALLGVCGFGETNAEIAKFVAKRLLEMDPLNGPAHVVLCNIYVANGWHVEEQKLKKEMGLKGLRKAPRCSWIILSGKVHMFLSGDKNQPHFNIFFSLCVGLGTKKGAHLGLGDATIGMSSLARPGRDLTGGGAFGIPGCCLLRIKLSMPAANVPPSYALVSISALYFDHRGHRFASAALDETLCTWQLEVGGRSNACPAESSLCFNSHST